MTNLERGLRRTWCERSEEGTWLLSRLLLGLAESLSIELARLFIQHELVNHPELNSEKQNDHTQHKELITVEFHVMAPKRAFKHSLMTPSCFGTDSQILQSIYACRMYRT